MTAPFARVAIVGNGLIGGSFALAIRTALPTAHLVGWDKPEILQRAVATGVVNEAQPDIALAIAGADLVYIALPVGLTIERLPEIARHALPGALVTDASSTKRTVCETAEKSFGSGARFLGGHPMAGNEGSGLAAADGSLFRGAKYALMGAADSPAASDPRVMRFIELLSAIGAVPMWMEPSAHDRAAALVSHLPQLLAVALAGVTHDATDQTGLPLTLAGRGLRDALRLAGSPYSVWRDIVLTNSDNLESALDSIIQMVEHLRAHLRSRELEQEFSVANEVYKILRDI